MRDHWEVRFEREFTAEFGRMEEEVQSELIAYADVLEENGPKLGRPYADRLKGSAYPNMKELRFEANGGVWRVAFAFDTQSRAVLLAAGDKAGLWDKSEQRFYDQLIFKADTRFKAYLKRVDLDSKRTEAERSPGAAETSRVRKQSIVKEGKLK